MNQLGPVSKALVDDVGAWVRRHGVVLWLDSDGHYTELVSQLAEARASGEIPFAVHGFRGSHLELMLTLAPLSAGLDRAPLLVHLPGFNEEAVRSSPLLSLYEIGVRYRKALDTLVSDVAGGRVPADRIAAFKAAPGLSLAGADAWLQGELEGEGGGLRAVLRGMALPAIIDDLLSAGFVADKVRAPGDLATIWEVLSTRTGMPVAWRELAAPSVAPRADEVAFAAASWALCVEYVDDLRRPPVDPRLAPARDLARPVVDACRALASHLRERAPSFYRRTAFETEGWLSEEVAAANAHDLGRIDTFRFEEDKILEAALAALAGERWTEALAWADPRVDGGSFWLSQDPARRSAWQLTQGAARLGRAIAAAGPIGAPAALDEALDAYVQRGAAVDQAHRQLAQRRVALLYPQLPGFEALRARLDLVHELWREWADDWCIAWNELCRSVGFLPGAELQQRTLFEDVVRPLTQDPGTTALFVVDALRYEMALELAAALSGTAATNVTLRARLAELPTVTEVGMNVLAPVAERGRLTPKLTKGEIQGFAAGEFLVCSPGTRTRAMAERAGASALTPLKLSEVLDRDAASLRRTVSKSRLVVVHSQEIDEAGENGMGPAVFDLVMQKLRAAWRLLREAGVRRFVFTADHGFLLLDEGAVQPARAPSGAKRRHALTTVGGDHPGQVRVPLSALGYEGTDEHLLFPITTAQFATTLPAQSFVHGGNSLQERVIPVLTVVHRAAAGGDTLSYALRAEAREGVAGMHCLFGRVELLAQQALDFGGARELELGLRVADEALAPLVGVELCQTRGAAKLRSGAVVATVGEPFELFFRLTGSSEARARIELHHPGSATTVTPCAVAERFPVTVVRAAQAQAAPAMGDAWLDELPEGGVRQVFAHLAAHGVVTEAELVAMLGTPRAVRKLAGELEVHTKKAPFGVRIDMVGGVKRYVREGSGE